MVVWSMPWRTEISDPWGEGAKDKHERRTAEVRAGSQPSHSTWALMSVDAYSHS